MGLYVTSYCVPDPCLPALVHFLDGIPDCLEVRPEGWDFLPTCSHQVSKFKVTIRAALHVRTEVWVLLDLYPLDNLCKMQVYVHVH